MRPVCLVTGASGRLGQVLCAQLAAEHEVVAVYRNTVPAVASQLRRPVGPEPVDETDRPSIHCVQADLLSRVDIRRVVEVAEARYGRIDAIVNAAADVRFHGRLVELWENDDEVTGQLAINTVAPVQLVSAVFQSCWKDQPAANARWNRCVVNVSSVSSRYVTRDVGQAFYAASKAALNMLTMYLALELAPYSVRANAICPARFETDAATDRVADAVRGLLAGRDTGQVLSKIA